MKPIITLNECYSSNLGDQAISKSLNNILSDYGFSYKNIYLTQPKQEFLNKIDYLTEETNKQRSNVLKGFLFIPYWYYKNRNLLKKLVQENQNFFIGGGQLINSSKQNYPAGFAVYLYFISRLIRKYNKNLVFIGIGCVSNFSPIEKRMYQNAINTANHIIVRDEYSKNMLRKNFAVDAIVMPDLAFYSSKKNNPTVEKEDTAILFVTDAKVVKQYSKGEFDIDVYYKMLIDKYEEFQSLYNNVFLAYTTKEDALETLRFKETLSKEKKINSKIIDIQDLNDLEQLLMKSKRVFAGRMHALILAKKNNCEIDPHILSEKIENFILEYKVKSKKEIQLLLNQKLGSFFRNYP